ncbi:hypothetical protein LTR62_002022 [Meristemomyces frigidus]|uniref:Uncharacterized protein n=1 Tax=Meristemomyces frigidus TaxID=1508187 RepID=A0AAN7TMV7_9PEZI|nr:hypothetical protein LTR62_002022 [Meristemomyces frigidus]
MPIQKSLQTSRNPTSSEMEQFESEESALFAANYNSIGVAFSAKQSAEDNPHGNNPEGKLSGRITVTIDVSLPGLSRLASRKQGRGTRP